MKKILLFVLFITTITFGNTGWFQDYITISGSIFWIGSDPGDGRPSLNGHDFGSVLTLSFSGASMKYWSDTQDRSGGAFYWEVRDQSNSTTISGPHEVLWTQNYLGGNDYNGSWSGTINILNGLSPNATYKLHVWAKSWGTNQGDSWLSNNSNNYVATFTTDAGLPVELKTFSAVTEENKIALRWETATEVNNYGFEVERKKTPQMANNLDYKWEFIGFVEGHGNSNSPKSYSYIDKKISTGKYQYRLKQIDIDGSYEYSDVVEVNLEVPNKLELAQNYPNPFNPVTSIQFSLPEASNVSLSVYNIIGEQVAEVINQKMEAGYHNFEFDGSKFNSGVYVYRLQTEKITLTKKMLLMK